MRSVERFLALVAIGCLVGVVVMIRVAIGTTGRVARKVGHNVGRKVGPPPPDKWDRMYKAHQRAFIAEGREAFKYQSHTA